MRREGEQQRRARRAAVDDPAIVMEAAAAFLAVRPRSVEETARRLRRLGYRDDLIAIVIERCVTAGYLDDEAFGTAWIESRDRARPRGRSALTRELMLKGLDRALIQRLLDERITSVVAADEEGLAPDGVELAAAKRLIERKLRWLGREPDGATRRRKGYALLARHGFDPETCRRALTWIEEALTVETTPVGEWSAGDPASPDEAGSPDRGT